MILLKTILKKLAFYRLVKIRKRYFLTRSNRLRLRYVVGSLAMFALTVGSFVGSIHSSVAFSPSHYDILAKIQRSAKDIVPVAYNQGVPRDLAAYASSSPQALRAEDLANAPDQKVATQMAAIEPAASHVPEIPSGPREEIIQIGAGETVVGALQNVGVSDVDAYNAVKALSEHMDPRSIKAGQSISVRMEPSEQGMEFAKMNMKIDPIKEVVVSKSGLEQFESELKEKEVLVKPNAVKALIKSSLYGSAARAGIPASIVAELIRIYSYEVDFQRDIREGDKLEVLFETYETEDGDFARYGNVIYANLMVEGRSIPVYRYQSEDGRADYYTDEGLSVRKTLMKTPIDGARISSGFGMRRHPILGYNKMHKGMDFAASIGTPIFAAGDGVIEFAGRKGAYGNYICVKHSSTLKSAYAHMLKFADGIHNGEKVAQGDVIGYVGTTGRSTGPHLHFEVIQNNLQINPASLKLTGQKLAGRDFDRFRSKIAQIRQQYVSLTQGMKFAKNENYQ